MKYRVIPYLPRVSNTDGPKDFAFKIETFVNKGKIS